MVFRTFGDFGNVDGVVAVVLVVVVVGMQESGLMAPITSSKEIVTRDEGSVGDGTVDEDRLAIWGMW